MPENLFRGKSDESYALAQQMKDAHRYNFAANRFYYSVFQAAKGFYLSTGEMQMDSTRDVHASIQRLLAPQPGPKSELRKKLKKLCSLREKADYQLDDIEDFEIDEALVYANCLRSYFLRGECE